VPLYTTGLDTGIIVDMGYQCAQILPIVRSRLCMEGYEVCYGGCGVSIERTLNENLATDNKDTIRPGHSGAEGERKVINFPKDVLEDLKARSLVTMKQAQKEEYLASKENVEKMLAKKFSLRK